MSENFTTPPPHASAVTDSGAATMSTPETLSGIFFEPERTFEALRARPRFLVAALVCFVVFMAFYLFYLQRVGYENIVNAEIEVRSQKSDVTEEQKQQGREIQMKPFVKAIRYASPPIGFVIVFAAGAAIYLLGVIMMGKSMSYKQALAVWVYSTLPPLVLAMIANIVLLLIRPPDPGDYDAVAGGLRGLVHANPGAFMSSAASPVLVTVLSALDLFAFYGLYLAALGLRKVAGLSAGSAWAIALTIWALGVVVRIIVAAFTHTVIG
ncbi:MAG: YIP1 family protein [Acidobacteria bacterium]|nr:YIP1 family protein [Acidobacteriota bacterium]